MKDPTMAGITDPAIRKIEMIKRIKHIEEEIKILEDRKYILECELSTNFEQMSTKIEQTKTNSSEILNSSQSGDYTIISVPGWDEK